MAGACASAPYPVGPNNQSFLSQMLISFTRKLTVSAGLLFAMVLAANAQLTRSFPVSAGARVEIINPAGRVEAKTYESTADADSGSSSPNSVELVATSQSSVTANELSVEANQTTIRITVVPSPVAKRIDLKITMPSRLQLKVSTEEGEVRVAGDIRSLEVLTDTGTIAADVPTDNVRYKLRWTASKPRYLSEFELEKVKEKAAGRFEISGNFRDGASGEKDRGGSPEPSVDTAAKDKKNIRSDTMHSVFLDLETARGIILINIPPNEVSSDLRERPLTDAAKAIIRSGDSLLMEAIRRAAPQYYADYTRTLPPIKSQPNLSERRNIERVTANTVKIATVRVSDINNRAVRDLTAADLEVLESGEKREIVSVRPSTAPFNLVLLLDTSGSVDNYVTFIRKAARSFVNTVDKNDRVSIVTFNDDIKVISKFTTDKTALSESLDTFDAGGATAYYDALAYTLADTLRPLKGDRTAIVILTDGDDNRSFLPFDSMLSAIQESGALIYPLYVPSALIAASQSDSAASVDSLRQRYLQGALTSKAKGEGERLAQTSGGVYYQIDRLSQIQTAYEDIVAQLRTAYEIEYRSQLGGADAGVSPRLRVRTLRPNSYVQVRSVIERK